MPTVTLRVIDGADRGKIYDSLPTPVTIGREEGNAVQLNDDRISRYHVKIQEDSDRLVLTDLESTNGTKVNGEDIQLKILRHGDLISIGRSVMLFGSRTEIANRLRDLRNAKAGADPKDSELVRTIDPDPEQPDDQSDYEFDLNWQDGADPYATVHRMTPPDLPDRLTPGQAAQLVEVLEYLHHRIRSLIGSVEVDKASGQSQVDPEKWQDVLDLQARLAEYLRIAGDPNSRDMS